MISLKKSFKTQRKKLQPTSFLISTNESISHTMKKLKLKQRMVTKAYYLPVGGMPIVSLLPRYDTGKDKWSLSGSSSEKQS